MEPGAVAEVSNSDDIQAQVLQTTLAEVETLRQKAADSEGADGENPPDCCVICLDSISDPCTALPCSHAHFDFLCLLSWLEQHPNCPLCKANVYKVRYADAQEGDAVYRVPNASRTRDTARDERTGTQHRPTHIDSAHRRRFAETQNGLLRETGRRCHRAPPTPDEAIERRRHVYRHNLYSLRKAALHPQYPIPVPFTHQLTSPRHRLQPHLPIPLPPPTPIQFSSTPHLVSRARLWLRRELQVFSFLSDPDTTNNPPEQNQTLRRRSNNAEFLLEYIIAILKTVDIQDSAGQAEAMLADFLGREHARLFLHELKSWLRSPAQGLAGWDREVQYPEVDAGGRRGRGVVVVPERDDGEREDGVPEDGEREGVSWRDRGGDHWRAGGGGGGRDAYTEGRRKRRRRDGDEVGEGRGRKSRRETPAGR